MDFRTVLPSDCYTYDANTGTYTDLRETDAGLRYLYDNGIVLQVSGIIRPSKDAVSAMLSGSIGYTSALTEYIITESAVSSAVEAQKADPSIDILNPIPAIWTILPKKLNSAPTSTDWTPPARQMPISALCPSPAASSWMLWYSSPWAI